jgi:hypothetical protein
MKRGDVDCDSNACKIDWDNKSNTICTMDRVITRLCGLSNADVRSILLTGIPQIEQKSAEHWINHSLREGLSVEQSWRECVPAYLITVRLKYTKLALDSFKYPNFIYYRPNQLTFIDVNPGVHDAFMSLLYWIDQVRKGLATKDTPGVYMTGRRESLCLSTTSETFLTDGLGFFSSSVYKGLGIPRKRGYPITFSENHKLTFQEKQIFEAYGFDPIGGDEF